MPASKVFLVIGVRSRGEDIDPDKWVVCAYDDRDQANEHVKSLFVSRGKFLDLVGSEIITPPPPVVTPNSGALNNDRGQVLFGARLTDGRSVLLLYTPSPGVAHLAVASDVVGELPDPEKRAEDFVTQTDREANRKKGQDERDWLDGLSAFSP